MENDKSQSCRLTDEERLSNLLDIYDKAIVSLHEKNESGEMKGTSALASQIMNLQVVIQKQIEMSNKSASSDDIKITFEGFDMAEMVERLAQERLQQLLKERGL